MSVQSISRVLKKVNTLPPLPAAVQRLCQLTGDSETDFNEIAEVISTDEALTTGILRVANSAYYGFSEKVSTISQAIVVMGIQGVKSLAVGVAFFDLGAAIPGGSRLTREQIWRHSLGVACGARLLAEYFRLENWKEAFVGGLLHDIGKIVFVAHFTEEYNQVLEEVETSWKPLKSIECEVFGVHHGTVGAELCGYWKLPPALIGMVYDRDLVVGPKGMATVPQRMMHAVLLGDNLSRMAGIGNDGDPQMSTEFMDVMESEGLSSHQLRQFLTVLPEEVHKAETFFKLTAPTSFGLGEGTPAGVGVILTNPKDLELVRITLLAIGCAPVSQGDVEQEKVALAGVVVDDQLGAALKDRLQQKGVPLLDYAQWHRENFSSDHTEQQLNIKRLESWLGGQLSRK